MCVAVRQSAGVGVGAGEGDHHFHFSQEKVKLRCVPATLDALPDGRLQALPGLYL